MTLWGAAALGMTCGKIRQAFHDAFVRIARKGGGKMGLPEVSLGVLPGTGGTQRLVRIVGKSKAIELMATGQLFDFERGLELGLVNQVFETENFLSDVLEYARQFTTPNKAAMAVGRIKRGVQTGDEPTSHRTS